jgi:anti-anti-sigma factor
MGSRGPRLEIEQLASLRVAGEIDMSNADTVEAAIVAAGGRGPVLLDLSELTFVDSAGIQAMLRAAGNLTDRSCLVLHGERPNVGRVFDLMGIDQMGTIHRVHNGQPRLATARGAHSRSRAAGAGRRSPVSR